MSEYMKVNVMLTWNVLEVVNSVGIILLSVCHTERWLNWLIQKRKAGSLLLEIKRSAVIKNIGWVFCFLSVAVAGASTFFSINLYQRPDNASETALSLSHLNSWSWTIFAWSVAIYCLVLVVAKPEIRQNGIYFAPIALQWRSIKSYHWDPLEPTRLILRVKHRFLFAFPLTSTMRVGVPARYWENVDRILEEYLPDKRQ